MDAEHHYNKVVCLGTYGPFRQTILGCLLKGAPDRLAAESQLSKLDPGMHLFCFKKNNQLIMYSYSAAGSASTSAS